VEQGDGVIALLDALDMKGVLSRASPEETIEAWRWIVRRFDAAAAKVVSTVPEICRSSSVWSFSDTIVLTMRGPNLDDLVLEMGRMIAFPFYEALVRGFFFRGVVSVGLFHQEIFATERNLSCNTIIGPAINEAAEWYERADWIGISASPSAEMLIDAAAGIGKDATRAFIPYAVPTNQPPPLRFAVPWPTIALLTEDPFAAKMSIVKALARGAISPAVASKYRNTMAFVNDMLGLTDPGNPVAPP
jgi:hypothetical protein